MEALNWMMLCRYYLVTQYESICIERYESRLVKYVLLPIGWPWPISLIVNLTNLTKRDTLMECTVLSQNYFSKMRTGAQYEPITTNIILYAQSKSVFEIYTSAVSNPECLVR